MDFFQVFLAVLRRHGGANEILARRHGRRDRHDGKNIFLEQSLPETVNEFFRAEDYRNGGRFALPRVEAEALEHLAVALGVFPEALEVLRFALHHVESGGCGGALARADGSAEDGLLGVGAQVFDEVARTGDESARAREGLRHAAADDVDLVVHLEVIDGAAALPTEHAEAVGVVEHGEAAGFLADLRNLGQAANVALHRIDALDKQHLRLVVTETF